MHLSVAVLYSTFSTLIYRFLGLKYLLESPSTVSSLRFDKLNLQVACILLTPGFHFKLVMACYRTAFDHSLNYETFRSNNGLFSVTAFLKIIAKLHLPLNIPKGWGVFRPISYGNAPPQVRTPH